MSKAARVLVLVAMVSSGSAFAGAIDFNATLSGAQEVSPPAPPGGVVTDVKGTFELEANAALSSATFVLKVFNGQDITNAHLHCGRAGENGPVVVALFGPDPGRDVNGRLASATITNADFGDNECLDAIGRPINNVASLVQAALDGLIYVNVHSVDNPSGQARGQLFEDDEDGCGPTYPRNGNGGRDHDSNSGRRH